MSTVTGMLGAQTSIEAGFNMMTASCPFCTGSTKLIFLSSPSFPNYSINGFFPASTSVSSTLRAGSQSSFFS